MTRWLIVAAGIAAAVALFLVLRPDDEGQPASSPSPEPTGTLSITPTETGTAPDATISPADALEVEVEVEDGRVRVEVEGQAAGRLVRVPNGQRIDLRVESQSADRIHVHGYDLLRSVPAGQEARLVFRATVPGVFEVELEDSGVLLFRLQVGT